MSLTFEQLPKAVDQLLHDMQDIKSLLVAITNKEVPATAVAKEDAPTVDPPSKSERLAQLRLAAVKK